MKPSQRITELIMEQKRKGRSDAVACDAAIILYLDEEYERREREAKKEKPNAR